MFRPDIGRFLTQEFEHDFSSERIAESTYRLAREAVTKKLEYELRVVSLTRVVVARSPIGFSATASEIQSNRPNTPTEKLPADVPDVPPGARTLAAMK